MPNRVPTFQEFAKIWFERKKQGLSNGKHIQQNWSTLAAYVFPHVGDLPLDEIRQRHILAALDPIWRVKHETAKRTLGRVKEVFELARVGFQKGAKLHLCRRAKTKLGIGRAAVAARLCGPTLPKHQV